jgi:sulfite oxidase
MNCQWRGPRVREILIKASVKVDEGHVAFACHQEPCQDGSWYGSSIELWRAMAVDREVILALGVQIWTQSYLGRADLRVDEWKCAAI